MQINEIYENISTDTIEWMKNLRTGNLTWYQSWKKMPEDESWLVSQAPGPKSNQNMKIWKLGLTRLDALAHVW